jgi:YD repeat-containing protein
VANVLVKPRSERDGRLVILADNTSSMSLVDLDTGEIIETGVNTGASNGRGATIRFSKPGGSYRRVGLMDDKGNIIATLDTAGQRVQFNYDNYDALIRQPVSTIEGLTWDNSQNIKAQQDGRPSNADIPNMSNKEYQDHQPLLGQQGSLGSGYDSSSAIGAGASLVGKGVDMMTAAPDMVDTGMGVVGSGTVGMPVSPEANMSIPTGQTAAPGGIGIGYDSATGAQAIAGYLNLGAQLMNIHNSDMTGEEKAQAGMRATALMVADMWTGGLASLGYNAVMQFGEVRQHQKDLEKISPGMNAIGALGAATIGDTTKNRELNKMYDAVDKGYAPKGFMMLAPPDHGTGHVNPEFEGKKAEWFGYSPEEQQRKIKYAELLKAGDHEGARQLLQGEDIWGKSAVITGASDITKKKWVPEADFHGPDREALTERQRYDISQAITDYNRMNGGQTLEGDKGRLGVRYDDRLREVISRIGQGEAYDPSMFGDIAQGYTYRGMPDIRRDGPGNYLWQGYGKRYGNNTFDFDELGAPYASPKMLTRDDITQQGGSGNEAFFTGPRTQPQAQTRSATVPMNSGLASQAQNVPTRSGALRDAAQAEQSGDPQQEDPHAGESVTERIDRLDTEHQENRRRPGQSGLAPGEGTPQAEEIARREQYATMTARNSTPPIPDPVTQPNLFYYATGIPADDYINGVQWDNPDRNNWLLKTNSTEAKEDPEYVDPAPDAQPGAVATDGSGSSGGGGEGAHPGTAAAVTVEDDPYAEYEEEAEKQRKMQLAQMMYGSSDQLAGQIMNEAFSGQGYRNSQGRRADIGYQQIAQALGRR